MFNKNVIPQEMKSVKRWCIWKAAHKSDYDLLNNPHGLKKIPWDAKNNRKLENWTIPNTWLSFDEAYQLWTPCNHNIFPGLGFFTGNGWSALDLDEIAEIIANHNLGESNLIDQIQKLLPGSYCELSQSQAGLHFLFKVNCKVSGHRKDINGHSRELYTEKRFIALTGNTLDNVDGVLTIDLTTWKQLYRLIFHKDYSEAPTGVKGIHVQKYDSRTDQELRKSATIIWRRINQYGSKYDKLNKETLANGYPNACDKSVEDIRVCSMLAYWGADFQTIDWFIRHSPIYRPKWDEKHGQQTYGEMTIAKAIAKKRPFQMSALG